MFLKALFVASLFMDADAYIDNHFWFSGRNAEIQSNFTVSAINVPVTMRVVFLSPSSQLERWRDATADPAVISLGGREFVDSSIDRISVSDRNRIAELQVGPESAVLGAANFSSVAILKHNNQIAFGMTSDDFESMACQPDSISTVPFFAAPGIALGWISSSISGDFTFHDGLRSVAFSGVETSAMFLLPPQLADEVYTSLLSIGAQYDLPEYRDEMRFLNCTRESALSALPRFDLVLTDATGVILTRIGLLGEDYMSFDETESTCRSLFLVSNFGFNRESFVIDPFKLPGINVRTTESSIMFCDSI